MIATIPAVLGGISSLFFLSLHNRFSNLGRIMGWIVLFAAACELTGVYTSSKGGNNLFVLHIYNVGIFFGYGLFFHALFKKLRWYEFSKPVLYGASSIVLLATLIMGDWQTLNVYVKASTQAVIIALCFGAYALLTLRPHPFTDRQPATLFIAGILISTAASFMVYLFGSKISEMELATQKAIWMINVGGNIVTQGVFLSALWLASRPNFPNQSHSYE